MYFAPEQKINKKQSQLGDSIFDSLKVDYGRYIGRNALEEAISVVQNRVNWNKGIKCYPYMTSPECVSVWDADRIINSYINLVKKGRIPEYNRTANTKDISLIEKEVANVCGRPLKMVKVVLWELYWASQSGALKNKSIIFPNTAEAYSPMQKTPPDVDSVENDPFFSSIFGSDSQKGIAGSLIDGIKWIIYGAVALIAVGGALYIYRFYRLAGGRL